MTGREIPKPLNVIQFPKSESPPKSQEPLSPKDYLKAMLEATEEKDKGGEGGFLSPLLEIEPLSLDELNNRIDSSSLALGQVPDRDSTERIVRLLWTMKEKFDFEYAQGMGMKKARKAPTPLFTGSIIERLKNQNQKPEDE